MKIKGTLAALFLSVAMTSSAQAVTIFEGLTNPMDGVTWNSLPNYSFDGGPDSAANAFYQQLSPYVDQQAYRIPANFSGALAGSDYVTTMFAEVTAYALTNQLLVCSPTECQEIFKPTDTAGAQSGFSLSSSEVYNFVLVSVEGMFGSSAFYEGVENFLAFKVVENKFSSGPGLIDSLELRTGDILVGIEDLTGPLGYSDRDFNDMFFVLREVAHPDQQDVPEPATLALLGLGALGARRLRQKALIS